MKAGYLSEFFTGVAMKTLSAVEADPSRSHQHEFNGANPLMKVFGEATEKQRYEALYIHLSAALLTMLGAGTTCKDRWRQILAIGKRIEHKHLLTLEAAISSHQTDQMWEHKLQLVIPRGLHETFTATQQRTLLTVAEFTAMVKEREGLSGVD
jgi:hypothetical protein